MTPTPLPTDAPSALALAASAFRAGNLDAALTCAGRAVQVAPDNVDALLALATVQHTLGDINAALPPLDRALRLVPADGHARQLRALVLRSLGRHDEARSERRLAAAASLYGRRAVCTAPDYAAALETLARAAVEAERPEVAAGLFGAVLGIAADREAAALGLARLRCAEGRQNEAEAILSAARDLGPGRPALHLALGDLLATAGRSAEAANAFRVAQAADPDALDTTRRLARVADGAEAELAWRRILDRAPDDAEACGGLATALAKAGRTTEALPFARRWVVLADAAPAATALLQSLTKKTTGAASQ